MKIFFGTVVRTAPIVAGGEIVRFDWETQRVEARASVVPENPSLDDPNPRGSMRGCRGIAIRGDEIVAASYNSLDVFDWNLALRRRVTHGLMAGLHEILLASDDRIWVTSTAIDAALMYDLGTGALVRGLWPRESPAFQERWQLKPMAIDKGADNRALHLRQAGGRGRSHVHLNAVALWRGRVLGLVRVHGAIVDLESGEILIEDPRIRGGHNLVVLEDDETIVVNDTLGQTVRFYDLPSRKIARGIDLRSFPVIEEFGRRAEGVGGMGAKLGRLVRGDREFNRPVAKPLFIRGLAVRGDRLWVGMSPAAIVCLDWRRGVLEGSYVHSRDVRHCIHGLVLEP